MFFGFDKKSISFVWPWRKAKLQFGEPRQQVLFSLAKVEQNEKTTKARLQEVAPVPKPEGKGFKKHHKKETGLQLLVTLMPLPKRQG